MNGLSASHVGELVRELAPLTGGLFVREVQAHPPYDLLLILEPEGGGPIRRVRVSASPDGARFHLQIGPVHRHTGSVGPFYRMVQSELCAEPGETKLRALSQVAGDRVVRFDFLTPSGARALALELFGRHPNVILLDASLKILAVNPAPKTGSRNAERLALRRSWEAPPARARSEETPRLVDAFPDPPSERAAAPSHSAQLAQLAPLSSRIETTLGTTAESRYGERKRRDLIERLTRRKKSAETRLRGLETQEETTRDAERVRMDAETLTAHLGSIPRGASEVELEDAYAELDDARADESPRRVISLDPSLSPKRNVERLFSRYRKLVRSRKKLPEEIELTRRQVNGLDEWIERASELDADPDALEEEAVAGGWIPARQVAPERKRPAQRKPYHRFVGCGGTEIRVGRSSRENDELTFKHARGNDLWFHTADSPGSHVVLVVAKGRTPDPEEILDAAHLAAHFSPLKHASKVSVHVAQRKEVKKPKRAKPGLVILSGGKTRVIRVEEKRIARLLATREKPRPGSQKPRSDRDDRGSGSQPATNG